MNHRHCLSAAKKEALEELRRDGSITILLLDKGRATVVMDKPEYDRKVQALLDDTNAYRTVAKDPMTTLKNQLNRTAEKLKRQGKISEDDLKAIRPKDSAMARFCGLSKIHKEGTPLPPIVSFRGTPTFGLAKWLSRWIQHLVEGSMIIVRSWEEFLKRLKPLRVEDDEVMMSFSVTSLFTSIPQNLAILVIKSRLWQEEPWHSNSVNMKDFIQLMNLCLKTYFTFQDTICKQVKGTPVGSPISGIIAEPVLQ